MFVLFGYGHGINFPNHGTHCCTFGTTETPDEAIFTLVISQFSDIGGGGGKSPVVLQFAKSYKLILKN
jgi:hypothetical protein